LRTGQWRQRATDITGREWEKKRKENLGPSEANGSYSSNFRNSWDYMEEVGAG